MIAGTQSKVEAWVEDLGAAVAALAGGSGQVSPGGSAVQQPWVATLQMPAGGSCVVLFDREGTAALGRAMSGSGADAPDAMMDEALRAAVADAVAAQASRPAQDRSMLTLGSLKPADEPPAQAAGASTYTLTAPGMAAPLRFAVKWLEPGTEASLPVPSDNIGSRIDVILDIDLPVVVRFGHTEMPLRALSKLGPGSVIELGRSPDDPVEILVSNRVVARGEVVIVGGNYGVRILDVTSQSERAHSLEG